MFNDFDLHSGLPLLYVKTRFCELTLSQISQSIKMLSCSVIFVIFECYTELCHFVEARAALLLCNELPRENLKVTFFIGGHLGPFP